MNIRSFITFVTVVIFPNECNTSGSVVKKNTTSQLNRSNRKVYSNVTILKSSLKYYCGLVIFLLEIFTQIEFTQISGFFKPPEGTVCFRR